MEKKKYVYVLFGNPSSFAKVVSLSNEINGVEEVEFNNENSQLTLYLQEQASEYDVFCSLTSMAETFSVDVDYADEEGEGIETSIQMPVQTNTQISEKEVVEEKERKEKRESPDQASASTSLPEEEKPWTKKYLGHFVEIALSLLLMLCATIFNAKGNFETILYLIAFSVVGYEIIWDAVASVSKKKFLHYSVVMLICSVVALLVASYKDATILVLIFQSEIVLGKVLNDVASEKLKKRLFFNFNSVQCEGEDETVFACQVQPQAISTFKSGETVPFDCEIIEGCCTVDCYNVTGKRTAISKKEGNSINGGEIVKNGEVKVVVKNTVEDSLAGKIYKKVIFEKDIAENGKINNILNKSVIVSFLLSIVVCFVAPIFESGSYSTNLGYWAYFAVIMFALSNTFIFTLTQTIGTKSVINHALSLSSVASSYQVLEKIAKADNAIFEDLGVLSIDGVKVDKIYPASNFKGKILKLLKDYSLTITEVAMEEFTQSEKNGKRLVCLSFERVSTEGVKVNDGIENDTARYVFIDGEYVGAITFLTGVKSDAYGAIRELKDAGVSSTVVSLDAQKFERIGKVATITEKFDVKEKANAIYVSNKKENANAFVNVVFDGINKVIGYEDSLVIANEQPKTVAKMVKLVKRLFNRQKNIFTYSIVFKVVALAFALIMMLTSLYNMMWLSVLLVAVVDCICLVLAYFNDSEVV